MKKNKMMWGMAFTALTLCLTLTGCPADAGGDSDGFGVPSLPGLAGKVSDLQDYTTPNAPNNGELTTVKNINEAVTLFSQVTNLLAGATGLLVTADTSVYNAKFDALFPPNNLTEILANTLTKKEASFAVGPIDDPTVLTTSTYGGVNNGRINGSSTATYKSNKPLGDFFTLGFEEKGDTFTQTYSGNRTFVITNGSVYASTNANLKVSGYIAVEYSSTYTQTLSHVLDKIYNNSSSDQTRFAVTLVASDGAKGAKFVLRGAAAGSGASTWLNTMNESGSVNISNLEVYDNDGNAVMLDFENNPVDPPTIPVDHHQTLQNAATTWSTFAQSVIARDVSKKFE